MILKRSDCLYRLVSCLASTFWHFLLRCLTLRSFSLSPLSPSEDLLLEDEPELVAFLPEHLGEDGVAAVEDGHLAVPHLADLREDLVPIGPAGVGPRLEAGDEVALLLLVHQVQGQLQAHRLHVSPLQGGRDVPEKLKVNEVKAKNY